MKNRSGGNTIQRSLTCFYLIPMWIVFTVNILFSLFRTTYFDLYMYIELPEYKNDHPVVLIILIGILFGLLMAAVSFREKIKLGVKAGNRIACCWAVLLSSFFVLLFRCGVVCDSGLVNDIVLQVMQGNYEAFAQGAYLHHYPFQIGLVAILEAVYSIFGVENFLAFQFINVISIGLIITMLQRITWELFEDEKAAALEAVISLGMLPLYLFATFIYGDLPGFALGITAVYFGIRYIKSDNWRYLLIVGALFPFAIIAKSNINVLLAAFEIIFLIKALFNRKWLMLLWALAIAVVSQAGVQAVSSYYAHRAGMERMLEGTPKTAWIAMSLQEANEAENGCGWYNEYNWRVYEDNGFDWEATNEACRDDIKASLKRFVSEPGQAVRFFYKKFVSQWNAPTFQAMITNEWYSRHSENQPEAAKFFLYGQGREIFCQWMNLYHLFMFICGSAGCLYIIKNWRLERAYFALNIFGGLFFHMIWEAQSRYILGYYVMLLPLAAVGCTWILGKFDKIILKVKRRRLR